MKKLFCDSMIVIMAIMYFLLTTGTSLVLCSILIFVENLNDVDVITTICLFAGANIVNFVIYAYCIPQWFAHIEMDKEGISLNTVYKKTKKESYDKYPFFTIASYQQIYTTRYFVVIGKRGLNLYELAHINRVKNSQEIIKLVLNKKTYKFLMKILPDNKKAILEKSLSQGKVVNSNTYKNMLERKNKRKKRRKRK